MRFPSRTLAFLFGNTTRLGSPHLLNPLALATFSANSSRGTFNDCLREDQWQPDVGIPSREQEEKGQVWDAPRHGSAKKDDREEGHFASQDDHRQDDREEDREDEEALDDQDRRRLEALEDRTHGYWPKQGAFFNGRVPPRDPRAIAIQVIPKGL
jgi:hypothetical protein